MSTYSNILVGIDLSSTCTKIIKKAKGLAEVHQARLHFAHIIEPLSFAFGGDAPINLSEAQSIVETQANKHIQAMLTQEECDGSPFSIRIGETAHELNTIACENKTELIIVGCQSRHGLALLFGSTASGVLHKANCDVLALRI